MTSISQPAIPNQGPSNASSASQQSASAHPISTSSSSSSSGRGSSQAAGAAAARSSYANATKKTFSPPPASSGGQYGKADPTSMVNGKVAIPPAIPTVGTPTIVNGNPPTSATAGSSDGGRKPSVTVSASGPSPYAPNGASMTGKPSAGSGIQFGSYNADGSPRPANATPLQSTPSASSLGVHNPSNPRITSPANSPSPIPQPPASGGKPPSHGHNISVSFGNSSASDPNIRPTVPPGPLAPGAQHLRRESSQSQHSDMSNHGMSLGPGRGGYPQQGGRGRGYGPPPYQQQMAYSPQPGHRQPPPNPSGHRGNMTPFTQGQQQNRSFSGFPNSPHLANRSPIPGHATPAHQQQAQMQMTNPHMGGSPYPYANQYGVYNPNVPPPQAYGVAGNYIGDPAFQPQYSQYYYPGGYPGSMQSVPTQTPRPPNQMAPHGSQGPFPGQFSAPVPQPMSRTSSAVSGTERPASGMGLSQPSGPTVAPVVAPPSVTASHSNASPGPKSGSGGGFQIPTKKSAPIVIRNPNSGDIVDLKKHSASPAPSTKSPANTSTTPTPPPRAPSRDPQHSRAESKSGKTDEEKRAEMKDAIARKVEADKAEELRKKEEAKVAQEVEEKEAQLQKEKEEAEAEAEAEAAAAAAAAAAKQAELAKAQEEAEKTPEARNDPRDIPKVVEPASEVEDEEAKKAREAQELEDEIARWEAEAAEQERKEAEAERAYAAKKQAEKDEAARKEAEAFKMDEQAMKKAEREAEAAEEARMKASAQADGGESSRDREDVFAALKGGESLTPASDTPAPDTPEGSGVATPASEAATAPAKTPSAVAKQKPVIAPLKLETTKPVESPQPTPQLLSLRSARKLTHINDISYPAPIQSPLPALNATAPMGKFKYDRDFLLQFQKAFTEKPSENWTERVKETLGDGPEPQSARATSARGGAGGGSTSLGGRQASQRGSLGVMGAFQNQQQRTLPPGTTSQSRFEASSRGAQPARPTMQNPLAGFVSRPGGGFPQPPATVKMDRTPSSTSMAHPNSPRNASQRGGSQRGSRAAGRREDPKDNKTMPLTAGAAIKPIEVSSSGWKPTSIGANSLAGPAPGGEGHMAPDVVQRKVKSNLNKMTPNNFDKISNQILEIAHQSKDETDGRSLRQVIQLTFEKATDEAHWAEMYAQFCHRMLESMSSEIKDESIRDKTGKVVAGGHLFRKYLLTRCQTEFERGWKVNLPEKPEGETEEAVMLSDAYYTAAAAKRRGLGLVRFIGELYKLGMLTERIMHECVKKLVDYEGTPDEAEVESLTSLLKTIGHQLDNTEKGRPMMDVYFGRINQMVALPDLPSRLRFMMMDIIDLRKANWQGKSGGIKGPTTLDEVRHQVAQDERQKEAQRAAENARKGGGGRMPMGRGDARAFSGGQQFAIPAPDYKTVGMDDLRRLGSKGGSRQISSQGPTFGPTSMFNSGRGSNTRKPLSIAPKDDSGASSRVSTPPAQKDKERKDEQEAKKSVNTFSALAALENADSGDNNASPAASPPTAKSAIKPVPKDQLASNRPRSKSPLGRETGQPDSPSDATKTS